MKFCLLLFTLGLSAWTADALLDTVLGSLSGKKDNFIVVTDCGNWPATVLSLTAFFESFSTSCNGALTVIVSGKNSSTIVAREVPTSSKAVAIAALGTVVCPDYDDGVYIVPAIRSIIAYGIVKAGDNNVLLLLLSKPPKDAHLAVQVMTPLISINVRVFWAVVGYPGWTSPNLPGVILNVPRYEDLLGVLSVTLRGLLCFVIKLVGNLLGNVGDLLGNLGG